jgi:hypothetical protein
MDHLMPELVERLNKHLRDRHATLIARVRTRLLRHRESMLHLLPYNENCGALRIQQGSCDATCRDSILREIETLLLQLVDANSREPVVASLARPASDHWGPKASSVAARGQLGYFRRLIRWSDSVSLLARFWARRRATVRA